jgi:hypothetical protein
MYGESRLRSTHHPVAWHAYEKPSTALLGDDLSYDDADCLIPRVLAVPRTGPTPVHISLGCTHHASLPTRLLPSMLSQCNCCCIACQLLRLSSTTWSRDSTRFYATWHILCHLHCSPLLLLALVLAEHHPTIRNTQFSVPLEVNPKMQRCPWLSHCPEAMSELVGRSPLLLPALLLLSACCSCMAWQPRTAARGCCKKPPAVKIFDICSIAEGDGVYAVVPASGHQTWSAKQAR